MLSVKLTTDMWRVQMKDWDGVVRAFYTYHAFVHYIHPFADGNGRLSRLLANIVLKSAGYLGVLTYQVGNDRVCSMLDRTQRDDSDQNIASATRFLNMPHPAHPCRTRS